MSNRNYRSVNSESTVQNLIFSDRQRYRTRLLFTIQRGKEMIKRRIGHAVVVLYSDNRLFCRRGFALPGIEAADNQFSAPKEIGFFTG